MNKKLLTIILSIIIIFLIIGIIIFVKLKSDNEIDYKMDKESIYDLFDNFPESNKIYYKYEKIHRGGLGPEIYQLYILAELTDNSYNELINKADLKQQDEYEIKINPRKRKYRWKNINNLDIIESKNPEVASIQSFYIDEETKTIYVIAIGGN